MIAGFTIGIDTAIASTISELMEEVFDEITSNDASMIWWFYF